MLDITDLFRPFLICSLHAGNPTSIVYASVQRRRNAVMSQRSKTFKHRVVFLLHVGRVDCPSLRLRVVVLKIPRIVL